MIWFDPRPRSRQQIFTEEQWRRFQALAPLTDAPDPAVRVVVGQPDLPAERVAAMPALRAVVNVEGNFFQNVDYPACFARGIQVLGVGPAFSLPVAEMALGMAIDLARGISTGDRAMRAGREGYGSASNRDSFLLTGAPIGLIGFGMLGRALLPLLRPFQGPIRIHDPWLPDGLIREHHCLPSDLDTLLSESRVIFVLAGVTQENQGFLDRAKLERIRPDAVFLLMSRAGVVEFDALLDLVEAGRFRAATDVFPVEPAPPDARARRIENLLLSSHRAGGMPQAFHAMGEMVIEDVDLILRCLPPQRLQAARPETVGRMRSPPGRGAKD